MKKRDTINESLVVDGFYVADLAHGFMGPRSEGRRLLRHMGLQPDKLPFSAASLIRNRNVRWKDRHGHVASVSFSLTDTQMEFTGFYLGNTKSFRVFREWEPHEDQEKIRHLESEAIGNLCMMCIYEKLTE